MAGKRCAPGFQRAENRYFDIKWRLFGIFGTTRRFDGNAARLAERCNRLDQAAYSGHSIRPRIRPLMQPLND
jgi:hypothetical protein